MGLKINDAKPATEKGKFGVNPKTGTTSNPMGVSHGPRGADPGKEPKTPKPQRG